MQTCSQSITSAVISNSYTTLTSAVPSSFDVNLNTNAIFQINSAQSQSIFINFLLSTAPTNISMSVTAYVYPSLNVVGTGTITQRNSTLTMDLTSGEFFICIRVFNGTYTGQISSIFAGYAAQAYISTQMSVGTYSNFNLTISPRVIQCNQPLWYSLESGSLPSGISLNSDGLLSGVLPLLDCDQTNKDVPPGNNFYYKDDYTTHPIGIQYMFSVRLSLQSDFTKFDIKNYCISIVNNWDKTKNPIVSIKIVDDIIDISEADLPRVTLPETLCCDSIIVDNELLNISLNNIDSGRSITLKELKSSQENILNMDDDIFRTYNVTTPNGTYTRSEAILLPTDIKDVKAWLNINKNSKEFELFDIELIEDVISGKTDYNILESDGNKFVYIEDNNISNTDEIYKFETLHIQAMKKYGMFFISSNGGCGVTFTLS